MTARTLRCAIYTRKSSEEGLDQDFTSLDAQREACAAYIQSQRHEGWTPVSTRYDDGGFSGGTLERPALRTLLADIDAGKIDLIVVYKIDRLTRSLAARPFLRQVCLHESKIEIALDRTALRAKLGLKPELSSEDDEVRLTLLARLHRTGHDLRLVIDNEHGTSMRPDAKLIRLVAKGRRWYEEIASGQTASLRSIARREGLGETYVSRVLHASLLAPDIIERILKGTQPVTLTIDTLRKSPLNWADQRRLYGITSK